MTRLGHILAALTVSVIMPSTAIAESTERSPAPGRTLQPPPLASQQTFATMNAATLGIFGSIEFPTAGFSPLHDWPSVLAQVERERPLYGFCGASGDALCPPRLRRWRAEIERLRPLPAREQVRQLNFFVNRVAAYAADATAHGRPDHWASPLQFLQNAGDCEDYATLKFFSLLELGFTNDALRIAIVRDRRRQILHAVVTVQIGSDVLVLDNLFDHPVAHHHMLKYVPIYSFNMTTQWAHIVTDRIRARFMDGVVAALAGQVPGSKKRPGGTGGRPLGAL